MSRVIINLIIYSLLLLSFDYLQAQNIIEVTSTDPNALAEAVNHASTTSGLNKIIFNLSNTSEVRYKPFSYTNNHDGLIIEGNSSIKVIVEDYQNGCSANSTSDDCTSKINSENVSILGISIRKLIAINSSNLKFSKCDIVKFDIILSSNVNVSYCHIGPNSNNAFLNENTTGDVDFGYGTPTTPLGVIVSSNITIGEPNTSGFSNTITGGSFAGLLIVSATTDVRVQNNLIGNFDQNSFYQNNGIFLASSLNNITIGGGSSSERNIISGNRVYGVSINGTGGVHIQNNFIGTNILGTAKLGNGLDGIFCQGGGFNINILENLISGNDRNGISLEGSISFNIQKNLIGTNKNGDASIPNGSLNGYNYLNDQPFVLTGDNLKGGGIRTLGCNALNIATVSNNVVSGNVGNGINLQSSRDITVSNNIVGLNENGNATLPNISLENNSTTGNGIASQNSEGLKINNNVLSGNDNAGIYVSNLLNSFFLNNKIGLNSVADRKFPNNAGIVISNSSNYLNFQNNIVSGNLANGIEIYNSAYNNFENNYIGNSPFNNSKSLGNGISGIHVINSSEINFNLNSIKYNRQNGLTWAGGNNYYSKFINNQVIENGGKGMLFSNNDSFNGSGGYRVLANNYISNNNDNGIAFMNGFTSLPLGISNNTITNNNGNGIDLKNSVFITISENKIYDNNQNSILLTNSNFGIQTPTISSINFLSNGKIGVNGIYSKIGNVNGNIFNFGNKFRIELFLNNTKDNALLFLNRCNLLSNSTNLTSESWYCEFENSKVSGFNNYSIVATLTNVNSEFTSSDNELVFYGSTSELSRFVDLNLPFNCSECIPSFSPVPGQKYVIGGWVREGGLPATVTSFRNPGLQLTFRTTDPANYEAIVLPVITASGAIIEGWQRVEGTFVVPDAATGVNVRLVNTGSGDVYFDDIRIHPFNANMKSFVYDPETYRLSAELDENNYATFYEYDEEGKLVRVKKETAKGIKTIRESRDNVKKTTPTP